MKDFFLKNTATKILTVILIVIVFFIFWTSEEFKESEESIKKNLTQYQKKEIALFVRNISNYLYKIYGMDLVKAAENKQTRQNIAYYLNSFITGKIKSVFIVYKNKNEKFFRILTDGNLNANRFHFKDEFDPVDYNAWEKVYDVKKPILIKHSDKKLVTLLYPVIEKNSIKYIIVVDFIVTPIKIIDNSLKILKNNNSIILFVMALAAVILVFFLFYDFKRQKEMQHLIKKLQFLNDTLEDKVKEEIEKNREKEKQLILQSRMASMGELLSMIAHQWRQPLNVMSLIVSKIKLDLRLGVLDEKNIQEAMEKLDELIKHLSKTIDDFRKFYRNEEVSQFADVKKLVDELLTIAKPSITNNNIEIYLDIKCDKQIKTYPNELKQVLLNLIKNAEDILIERKVENPYIKISAYYDERKNVCVIEVSDNAGGVDEKIKDKIFNPYFTTKNEINGTGLGLYMSKQIVEDRLKGRLKVYNSDEGAVFRLEIKSLKE